MSINEYIYWTGLGPPPQAAVDILVYRQMESAVEVLELFSAVRRNLPCRRDRESDVPTDQRSLYAAQMYATGLEIGQERWLK